MGTKDEDEARTLAEVKHGVIRLNTSTHAELTRPHQAEAGAEYVQRTWDDCYKAFNDPAIKSESSIRRMNLTGNIQYLTLSETKQIADTDASDLTNILKNATASGCNMMFMLRKFAIDDHWTFEPTYYQENKRCH